jgi:hypothetical protein
MSVFKFGQGHWGFSHLQRIHKNFLLGFDYFNLVIIK